MKSPVNKKYYRSCPKEREEWNSLKMNLGEKMGVVLPIKFVHVVELNLVMKIIYY